MEENSSYWRVRWCEFEIALSHFLAREEKKAERHCSSSNNCNCNCDCCESSPVDTLAHLGLAPPDRRGAVWEAFQNSAPPLLQHTVNTL